MASFINHCLPTFLIFFIMFPSSFHSYPILINLTNDTKENLRFSCKSSTHKDLAAQTLLPDDFITWNGDINVPGENEIWLCLLNTTPGNLKGLFALFDAKRDQPRCGPNECFWSARHDGIYLYLKQGMTLQFRWQNWQN
uniref:S-protein homolog n=1 Tax=Daucus carota subsp. sativus TaxID=79200 RepID=A0A165ZJ96_DAUCS